MENTKLEKTLDPKKELEKIFFSHLYDLLDNYIEPKSRELADEICKTIKDICRSHGYWWNVKYTPIGEGKHS